MNSQSQAPYNARPRRASSKPRTPKPLNQSFIEEAALAYLNRFDATQARLASVLQRRVKRAALALPEAERPDPEQTAQWIAEVLERYVASGLLDDTRFAEGLCRSLRNRGCSRRAIMQRLRAKGVLPEVIERVLESTEQRPDEELQAARTWVRRKRLGPHRPEEQQAPERHKDLARLARAGFSFDVARRALTPEQADVF